MSEITVGDLRRAIEGRPDDELVERHLVNADEVDEMIDAEVTIEARHGKGRMAIVVTLRELDPYGDDEEDDGDEGGEPIGSCDECGQNLYGDEHGEDT